MAFAFMAEAKQRQLNLKEMPGVGSVFELLRF